MRKWNGKSEVERLPGTRVLFSRNVMFLWGTLDLWSVLKWELSVIVWVVGVWGAKSGDSRSYIASCPLMDCWTLESALG